MIDYFVDFDKLTIGDGTESDPYSTDDFLGLPYDDFAIYYCKGSWIIPYSGLEIDFPLVMRGWNNVPFNLIQPSGTFAVIISIRELSQCRIICDNSGSGNALNFLSGIKQFYPDSLSSVYNSCQFISLNDEAIIYVDGVFDIDLFYTITTSVYFNGCSFDNISLLMHQGAVISLNPSTGEDQYDYFQDCIFHTPVGSQVKAFNVAIPHYTYLNLKNNLFINTVYIDAINYWYDVSGGHTNRVQSNIDNGWGASDILGYPLSQNATAIESSYANFSDYILMPPDPGNPPYTGYNFGFWSSIRVGIGVFNFAVPVISIQPQSQIVVLGSSVTFSVTAAPISGTFVTYQWKKGINEILGAIDRIYTILITVLSDVGNYSVTVTNAVGSVVSDSVRLDVNPMSVIISQKVVPDVFSGYILQISLIDLVAMNSNIYPIGFVMDALEPQDDYEIFEVGPDGTYIKFKIGNDSSEMRIIRIRVFDGYSWSNILNYSVQVSRMTVNRGITGGASISISPPSPFHRNY